MNLIRALIIFACVACSWAHNPKCYQISVEVGARGIPAKSLHRLLKDLGLPRSAIGTFMERASKMALTGSYSIWLSREGNEHSAVDEPDQSETYRPCCLTDTQCIREEFIKRNWFVTMPEFPEDPFKNDLVIPEVKISESYFNLTITIKNAKFSRLQTGTVEEFYINNKTNRAVLALKFRNFNVEGAALFIYHRMAREPVVVNTYIKAHYPSMVSTTIIGGLAPCEPHTFTSHSRVNDMPSYNLGCGFDKIKDPELKYLFKNFGSNISAAIQGSSLEFSPKFAQYYMAILTKPRPNKCPIYTKKKEPIKKTTPKVENDDDDD